ncbi:DedA family protein [Sphingomonas astaxanthinifaciens]|uniref:Membrane protein n=1 Tax=Sphingomonas astaxanthinifaciens DSM 22298 TaxID=1123267 RepID=A0ABQ5Z6N9_9SPHN|nr:DedA family protein [Sphingomonas astaxanthinifaciens]GLR48449.1 membrane protein [Sphingomonas astaxanthinifaciens DSM 22298]
MTLEALIAAYGLPVVLLGAALEGETAALLAGMAAHRGWLPLPSVMAALALGSFLSDQGLFLAGRRLGRSARVQGWLAKPAARRAVDLLERRPRVFLLGFRFLWGLRTVSPLVIGASKVPARLYLLCNILAASLWGVLFASLGYIFGAGITRAFGRIEHAEHLLLWAIPIALLIGLGHWLARRRNS